MPAERPPPPEILITSSPVQSEQVHHLPVGPPPTPRPQLSPQLSTNSLELHIPIPIPTPPTPLPIIVAYPLSVGPVTPASEPIPLEYVHYSNRDTMRTDDSGIELEPVPAPVLPQRLRLDRSVDSEETLREMPSQENDYELVDMTDEERLDAQTVYLFRALNVPLNVHKLRAMHAKGKLPAPLLKFRYGSSRSRHTSAPGKENANLTSILKTSGTRYNPIDDPNAYPESPKEMETVQGESWYLPSATARFMTRQRSRFNEEQQVERDVRNWESSYPYPREFRHDELPAPQPIIPNQALLDQFPLPPPSLPSVISQPDPTLYSAPLPPTPSPAPSSSGRPLGYMYAKPMRRTPSCKSCGGSPASSAPSSRTLTPAAPPGQGIGAYYAYDLLTPSPGALPYSGLGSGRSVSPMYPASFAAIPVSQRHFS